jgi:hypothetical protein
MRQIATSYDGAGYEIRSCRVIWPNKTEGQGAQLTVDGLEVAAGDGMVFRSFADARLAARELQLIRVPEGSPAFLDWRTE